MCLATEISVWFGNLLVSPDIEDQQGTQNIACVQTITIILYQHFSISVSLPMEKQEGLSNISQQEVCKSCSNDSARLTANLSMTQLIFPWGEKPASCCELLTACPQATQILKQAGQVFCGFLSLTVNEVIMSEYLIIHSGWLQS